MVGIRDETMEFFDRVCEVLESISSHLTTVRDNVANQMQRVFRKE